MLCTRKTGLMALFLVTATVALQAMDDDDGLAFDDEGNLQQLSDQIAALQQESVERASHINELHKELHHHQIMPGDYDRLKSEVKQLYEERGTLTQQVHALQLDLQKAYEANSDLHHKHCAAQKEADELRYELKVERNNALAAQTSLNDLKRELADLRLENEKLSYAVNRSAEEIRAQRKQLSCSQNKITTFREENKKLRQSLSVERELVKTLRAQQPMLDINAFQRQTKALQDEVNVLVERATKAEQALASKR